MEEELEYLKQLLAQVHRDSHDIEKELEAELLEREELCNALQSKLDSANAETELWKKRFEEAEARATSTDSQLASLTAQIRSLEADNDDMEQSSRIAEGNINALKAENQEILERLALTEADTAYQQVMEEKFERKSGELREAQEEIASLKRALETGSPPSKHAPVAYTVLTVPPQRTPSLRWGVNAAPAEGHVQVRKISATKPELVLQPTRLRSSEWALAEARPSHINANRAALARSVSGKGHGLSKKIE